MDKTQDRKNLIAQIEKAANLYRTHLVGKKFLYVFNSRYIEVIYKAENFRHLTGVATTLSAKRFYSYASRHLLSVSQIGFNSTHPYDLSKRKIKHIGQIVNMAEAESLILEEITTTTQCYKFGTTNLNFTLCMNRELDSNGQVKNECYVVESLRDEDCFSKSKNVFVVSHIFSKKNDAKKYTDLLYMDSSSDMESLPESIKVLLSPELLIPDSHKI